MEPLELNQHPFDQHTSNALSLVSRKHFKQRQVSRQDTIAYGSHESDDLALVKPRDNNIRASS